jgi:hypothetical protein
MGDAYRYGAFGGFAAGVQVQTEWRVFAFATVIFVAFTA